MIGTVKINEEPELQHPGMGMIARESRQRQKELQQNGAKGVDSFRDDYAP